MYFLRKISMSVVAFSTSRLTVASPRSPRETHPWRISSNTTTWLSPALNRWSAISPPGFITSGSSPAGMRHKGAFTSFIISTSLRSNAKFSNFVDGWHPTQHANSTPHEEALHAAHTPQQNATQPTFAAPFSVFNQAIAAFRSGSTTDSYGYFPTHVLISGPSATVDPRWQSSMITWNPSSASVSQIPRNRPENPNTSGSTITPPPVAETPAGGDMVYAGRSEPSVIDSPRGL
mmetsp:Transcript_4816/g.10288  ORF Transcript_4816/g.10288 Transcript_4816/m.10288 type:complete len:233 (-) Transcript_4816:90-788(-)